MGHDYGSDFIEGYLTSFETFSQPLTLFGLICLYLCCLRRNKRTNRSVLNLKVREVARSVRDRVKVVTDIEDTSVVKHRIFVSPPPGGIYQVEDRKYGIVDKKTDESFIEGNLYQTRMHLIFQEIKKQEKEDIFGWSIRGTRSCGKEGNFTIRDGFVSSLSYEAYWEEEMGSVRRIVKGHFLVPEKKSKRESNSLDESNSSSVSFDGEWLSSDGTRGKFLEFRRIESVETGIPISAYISIV